MAWIRPLCVALALSFVSGVCGIARAQQADPLATAWYARYEAARAELVREHFAQAAAELETLASSAPTPVDRSLAQELAGIARARLARNADSERLDLRTSDELAVLYTSAVFYGLGTAGWLTLQIKPETIGGALLPFALITPAAVGVVALVDGYRPLPRGVPHAISAGMYLGFGEALWLVGYQHAYASHHDDVEPWHADRVSTALWVGSTLGAGIGGLVGALSRPTPGRLSFTASAGLWAGMLSAFAASAIEPDRDLRAQTAYLAGGVGYNVGLVAGMFLAPQVAPSIARVRFIDLGGLGGAVLGAGLQGAISQEFGTRANMGAAAIGGAIGLGLSFWATADMPAEQDPRKARAATTGLSSVRPMISPIRGGFTAGLAGQL